MTKELNITNEIFESIKHLDSEGNEYWYARELQKCQMGDLKFIRLQLSRYSCSCIIYFKSFLT